METDKKAPIVRHLLIRPTSSIEVSMSRFFSFFLLFLFASVSFAQSDVPSVGVDASAMFYENDQNEQLKRDLTMLFKKTLSEHDIAPSGDVRVVFFLDAKELDVNGEPSIVLSIVEGHSLPPAVIEAASENESLYATVRNEELPEEGKWVREYVTRERLKNFVNLNGHEVNVVSKEDLQSYVKTYLESRLKQMRMI